MKSPHLIIFISFLLVISSGSIGSVEKSGINGTVEKILKVYNDAYREIIRVYDDFIDRNFKSPNYDVRIIEVTNLKDCFDISLDAKSPCILVNLNIENNQNDTVTFEITGRTIVTKDGKQLDKYGGIYNTKQLNSQCDTENFFKLFPNANKKLGVCFPVVSKNDSPVMYIGVKANGKEKEYNFNIASNLS